MFIIQMHLLNICINSKQFLDISVYYLPNTTARVSVAFRSLSSFLICWFCLLFFLHAVAFLIISDFFRNLFPAEIFVFSANLTLFTCDGFSLWLQLPLVSSLRTELPFFVQLILFCKWPGEEYLEEFVSVDMSGFASSFASVRMVTFWRSVSKELL